MTQASWGQTLRHNHFSPFNVCLSDYNDEAKRTEVLVSTAVETDVSSETPTLNVCVDKSNNETLLIARNLKKTFNALNLVDLEGIWADRSVFDGKLCLFLGDITGKLSTSWTLRKINDLFQLLSSATRTLWVTQANAKSRSSQAYDLMRSFARSSNKKSKHTICTLSLSTTSTIPEQASVICKILQSFPRCSEIPSEIEYIENQGRVTISRFLIDEIATDRMKYSFEAKRPSAITFQQGDQPIKIEDLSSRPGSQIVLARGSNATKPLGKEEIEILPQYISLSARKDEPLFPKSGYIPEAVKECSGTVTRVGSTDTSALKVGDRVCAIGSGPACNHFRAYTETAHLIPPHVSYEEALSIPIILVTALYCLKQRAKARKGESILIYQAAQALGQALVTLAQFMGLDVYAVIDEMSEQTILTERFGIPVARIFATSEIDIHEAPWTTEDHGKFSIVIGCSNQSFLQQALRCIACSGSIISLGSIPKSTSLCRLKQLRVHCTVSIVDADVLYHQEKLLFHSLSAEVMELVEKGAVKLPLLTSVLSLSAESKRQKHLPSSSDADRYFIKTNCNTSIKVSRRELL